MGAALKVSQVADRLNVNDRTVYRLAQAGNLPGFKVAGSWRFLEEDIESWIDEQKRQAHRGTPNAEEPKNATG